MSKPVTVGNLYDQIGKQGPHPILYCVKCGAEFSANKGDYWNLPDSYVFRCCRRLMKLVVKRTVYQAVA